MQRESFLNYLITERKLKESTARSRVGNCSTIEDYEGDLDSLFAKDRLHDLKSRLIYSKSDERAGEPAKHRIPIDGNIYNGTATYRNALQLYEAFKNGGHPVETACAKGISRGTAKRAKRGTAKDWPTWNQPNEEDSLLLAQVVARYIKFLSPEIVEAIARDNDIHRSEWCEQLQAKGVNPDLYLWPGSACSFPGVRRHAGSKEISQHWSGERDWSNAQNAIYLDDNDYPKQIWSFTFRNTRFAKRGPDGYQLAHLVDHKEYKNRSAEELVGPQLPSSAIPGLYTCASNAAYVPTGLLKPTDFNKKLRNLIQRRAEQLYGSVCNLFPNELQVAPAPSSRWNMEQFEWGPCVGTLEHMKAFLEFRAVRMEALLRKS